MFSDDEIAQEFAGRTERLRTMRAADADGLQVSSRPRRAARSWTPPSAYRRVLQLERKRSAARAGSKARTAARRTAREQQRKKNARWRRVYYRHQARYQSRGAQWAAANRLRKAQYMRQWRQRNRARLNAYDRWWRKQQKTKHRAQRQQAAA